jgi:hypothetical protein
MRKSEKKEGRKVGRSEGGKTEVGPVAVPERRDYAAAGMRKAENQLWNHGLKLWDFFLLTTDHRPQTTDSER